MKAVIPLCFLLLSAWAIQTKALASYPLVIQDFVPFSTQWSDSRLADANIFAASLPLPEVKERKF